MQITLSVELIGGPYDGKIVVLSGEQLNTAGIRGKPPANWYCDGTRRTRYVLRYNDARIFQYVFNGWELE